MSNRDQIHKFYTALSAGDSNEMVACYHETISFQDPVFGLLEGKRANKMWEMLLSKNTENTRFTFSGIEATTEIGMAKWEAEYYYGKRKVINKVKAEFKFKDGKIIEHIDTFDMWKWTQQAFGATGYLLGWTPFMKKEIRKTVNKKLDRFIEKNPA
ncbi:nuclear transport factor 2 family protein [uncultured Marivirga sp.]|uniref:nuclear transport factor 2 family protein n=1 Tax=uncultured Marivirga sp. TaxID=1123707 RepID=UPI0030EB521B|tara:strand:- start:96820 stop:97287 length:468 start_codon:yes stop_codon:yes gene_type:complete